MGFGMSMGLGIGLGSQPGPQGGNILGSSQEQPMGFQNNQPSLGGIQSMNMGMS